jgi:transcriptional regulator with XRE-family HTH domain
MAKDFLHIEKQLKELDLSIADLASYLNISKTSLHRVMNGKQELPGSSMLFYGQLLMLIYKSKDVPDFIDKRIQAEKEQLSEDLKKRNIELKALIERTEQRLREMIEKHKHILLTIKKYSIMDGKSEDLEAQQEGWIKSMIWYWESKLALCDLKAQHLLTVKIATLRLEMEMINKSI